MGRSHDRISNLPDPILQFILTLMPLKSAIRTSTLSRRWRNLWVFNLISATSLDFNEEFANSQSPKEFVTVVNRYLQLYNNEKLVSFRVLFCPFNLFLPDIEHWIAFATRKIVKKLDLDLSQGYRDPRNGEFTDGRSLFKLPNCLFDCDSLTHLSLSRCQLPNPLDFRNFGGLESLSLSNLHILDEMLHRVLTDCPLLENLYLKNCHHLDMIWITAPSLRLQRLVLEDCWGGYRLEILAPRLRSFQYSGNLFFHNYFTNVSSLVDASICSIARACAMDRDYLLMLKELSHVEILTLCTATLMNVTTVGEFDPNPLLSLQNLQELQLLIDSMTDEHLTCIRSFFRLCPSPFLEKLFVRLPVDPEEQIDISFAVTAVEKPSNFVFDHLKVIKVSNFTGRRNEMRLVKFLLEKAIVLESIILVATQMPLVSQPVPKESIGSRIILGQLSLLPKASSNVCIVLCECSGEEDCRLSPTHKEFYYDYC